MHTPGGMMHTPGGMMHTPGGMMHTPGGMMHTPGGMGWGYDAYPSHKFNFQLSFSQLILYLSS